MQEGIYGCTINVSHCLNESFKWHWLKENLDTRKRFSMHKLLEHQEVKDFLFQGSVKNISTQPLLITGRCHEEEK